MSLITSLLFALLVGQLNIDLTEGFCCWGDCDGLFSCCGNGSGACNVFCCNCDTNVCGNGAFSNPETRARRPQSSPDLPMVFNSIDTNKDKKISNDEFETFFGKKIRKGVTEGKVYNLSSFDHNGDGYLSQIEIDSKPKD